MRSLEFTLLLSILAAPLAAQSPQPAMGAPLDGLDATQLQRFLDGKNDFNTPLSVAGGLGPTFNQVSCANCHNNPIGGPGVTKVTRFGFDDGKGGFDPLTALGGTLLQQGAIDPACLEVVPPSANLTSFRLTPSALGAGLVEAIADADIVANATTPPSANVSGRVHMVTPLETPGGAQRVGRFGWKAQVATVLTFSGDASLNEMGLTNRLVPTENAPNGNLALLATWDGVADPEDGPDGSGLHFIDRITNFQRYLAAPPQTPRSGMTGEGIFHAVGCADCHISTWQTRNDPALESAIRNKTIKPYSDFLLHDMGAAADFIPDGAAGAQELRTPSLWGVRRRDPLWHDGRVVAGTLQSRILGAGGVIDLHAAFGSEARPSALAFQALTSADQLHVVAFLDSLGRREFDGNGDNVLDATDIAAFRVAAGGGPYTADDPEAVFDFDQDGDVDVLDLAAFAAAYEGDCDGDGVNDLDQVVNHGGDDANQNWVLDSCEFCQVDLGFAGGGALKLSICGDVMTTPGSRASFQLTDGPPNALVLVAISPTASPYLITPTEYLVPTEPLFALIDFLATDAQGELHLPMFGGGNAPTWTWVFQAATFDGVAFDLSNAVELQIGSF